MDWLGIFFCRVIAIGKKTRERERQRKRKRERERELLKQGSSFSSYKQKEIPATARQLNLHRQYQKMETSFCADRLTSHNFKFIFNKVNNLKQNNKKSDTALLLLLDTFV
jgi:hypothetical protein